MASYKKALYVAAREAYRNEIIASEMLPLVIGEGKEFANSDEWIEERVQEWLEEVELEKEAGLDG